jgi:hypothetical protein
MGMGKFLFLAPSFRATRLRVDPESRDYHCEIPGSVLRTAPE